MRCYICDKDLTDKEVVFNKELGSFEPCTICLDIALDAAYSGKFARPEESAEGPGVVGLLSKHFDEDF